MLLFFYLNTWGCTIIKELQINEEIRLKELRLIASDGEQLGIFSSREALEIAEEKDLDLVLISPNANPPVCKIMDYGKYRYDLIKKNKEAKKKQKTISVKEVRLSPNIENHDLNVKARQAIKILSEGDKVKVSIRFRGRELAHTELGDQVMEKYFDLVKEHSQMEKKPKMEGRSLVMFLSPLGE